MLQYFSEGKNDYENNYLTEDFIFRWKKLLRVVEKEEMQGLLLITGLDCCDCVFSAYLFNWLFLGLSGQEIYVNKYLQIFYNELIILISPEHSYIFITPEAKNKLDTLIYSIPNCTVFCPTNAQYSNKEILDTLKITSFYDMTKQIRKIAIFLAENESTKTIEKWSIIQSYALESVGRTFFTLQFQVVNFYHKIVNLFKNMDKHCLKNLVSRTAYSMQGHIKGTTKLIELTNQSNRSTISEVKLQQSLQQAVDISMFESKSEDNKNMVKILFGIHTNSQLQKSSEEIKIQTQQAFHVTISHFDPYTKIQVWRTYFLQSLQKQSVQVQLTQYQQQDTFITVNKYQISHTVNKNFLKNKILLKTYEFLVQGLIDSIGQISKDYRNLNKQFLIQFIFNHILSKKSIIPEVNKLKKQDFLIELESYDSFGDLRPIDFKDTITFKLTSTFYVLKCRINNIKCSNNSILGALIFSECFILQQGCFLLLTKNVPYLDFWQCRKDPCLLLEKINPNYEFQELGALMNPEGFKNRIFIPKDKMNSYHFYLPVMKIKYYFHENGLRLFSEKFGWRMILYHCLKDITMINKISGQWVLFTMQNAFLMDGFQQNIIAIQFRGKAFETLLKKVNDKKNPLAMTFSNIIPPILNESWQFTRVVLKKQIKQGALIQQYQIIQNQFLWSFIESKQLMILNHMKDIKLINFKNIYKSTSQNNSYNQLKKNKINLVLINGTYGSRKLKIAQVLKSFGQKQNNFQIFHISVENLYSRMQIKTFVEQISTFCEDNKIDSNENNIVIIVVPSWLNCADLLTVLCDNFHVKTIISKVNASNFFVSKNKNLVQNVLTFILPGHSQHIILDTTTEDESTISNIMKIIWNYNSYSKVYRAMNCMLTTGQCADILKDNSYMSQYQSFLRVKYGSLYKFDALNKLCINYIEFKLPVYDLHLIKILSKTNGYLIDINAIKKDLFSKKQEAQNSKDQLMIGLYNLEQSITICKKKQKVTQLRSLKGIIRLENKEQIEFAWANREYRQSIVSSKEYKSFGLFIISSKYDELQFQKFLQSLTYKKYVMENLQLQRTKESISEQQLKNIQKQGRDKYLENGEFYDGYFFRDVEGYILQHHPSQLRLIKEWLQKTNEEIKSKNQTIKQQWQQYCRKYE